MMKTISTLLRAGLLCASMIISPVLWADTLVSVTLDTTAYVKVPVGENPMEAVNLLFVQEGGTVATDRIFIEEFGTMQNILFGESFEPTKPVIAVIENAKANETARTTCPPLLPARLPSHDIAEYPWIFLPDSYSLTLDANGRLSCRVIGK